MKNIRLPNYITNTYFNCFEQQIMTLCFYYHKEFWKLFINQKIKFLQENICKIEDTLVYENSIMKNAERYYGITLRDIENMDDLKINDNQIYLANIDTNNYPYTMDLDEAGTHYILVFGGSDVEYYVNDNYYKVDNYILNKNSFIKGIRRLRIVKYTEKNLKMIVTMLLRKVLCIIIVLLLNRE